MGVVNAPSGKPTMHLTGGAAKQLQKLLPAGTRAAIHLTITDDFPLAQAFVIIEALPECLNQNASGRSENGDFREPEHSVLKST